MDDLPERRILPPHPPPLPRDQAPLQPMSPLQYSSGPTRPSGVRERITSVGIQLLKFIAGIILGLAVTAISAGLVAAVGQGSGKAGFAVLVAGLVAKIALASGMLAKRNWRMVGAGVLTSIALLILLLGAGVTYVVYTCSHTH